MRAHGLGDGGEVARGRDHSARVAEHRFADERPRGPALIGQRAGQVGDLARVGGAGIRPAVAPAVGVRRVDEVHPCGARVGRVRIVERRRADRVGGARPPVIALTHGDDIAPAGRDPSERQREIDRL